MQKNDLHEIIISGEERLPECGEYLIEKLKEGVCRTLEYCDFKYKASVSVSFFDEAEIHALNLKYRGVNRPTDVLSFPMFTEDELNSPMTEDGVMLGDIAICIDKAEEQARELSHSLVREVTFLAIHSTLHLLGYDHERSPEDDEKQCSAQREIISKITFEE